MIFATLSLGILSVNPIEFGLQFLEKMPNKLECSSGAGKWSQCSQQQICKGKKNGENVSYRAVSDDPEYIVNWVDKLGLLCESHQRIGFLGSSYFIGVVVALMFVPAMSDRIGRREMFCFTLLVSIFAQIGLMWSNSLNISFGFMIVLGLTWPGKRVTGITYFLEFIPA